MNIDLLRELEGVVLDFYEKKKMMGVSFLTGVLGVLIDLKPAALLINDKLNDSKLLDNKRIMEILNKLGVDLVRERLNKFSNEELNICIWRKPPESAWNYRNGIENFLIVCRRREKF